MTGEATTVTDEAPFTPIVQVRERPRAAMIVNPYSSGITSARERKIVEELREHMDLEVRRTERGGHAPKLARDLIDEHDLDVLIACGGDGTANEVLNGIGVERGSADRLPLFAILPAGGTNVLARSVGFTNHPIRATKQLAQAILERRSKRINLATVDERIFMFSAGVGLDAEVVKRMEQRRSGRRPSDTAHLASVVGIYATSRWVIGECMTVTIDGDEPEELRAAVLLVGNTTPLTYMGKRAVHFMPEAQLDLGLDFIAPHRVSAFFAMRYGAQAMGVGRSKHRLASPERLQRHHDIASFTVTCDDPQPVQVDGEFIGDRTHIRFATIEHAIDLIVP